LVRESYDEDERYMLRCINVAAYAEGQTSPNPLVGCVVVGTDGQQIAQGYHARAGENHAEVNALDMAGEAARGGTLYCSLEPCCHHGRTPPCTDRVIKSGVKRVVVGLGDPNPKVAGGGIKALRDAGIEVVTGVLEDECRYQNRAFLKSISQSIPWVALKMAVTLDGKIADRHHHSQWITGPEAREQVMYLRSAADAIMVGAGTARSDDPSLTVRFQDLKFQEALDACDGPDRRTKEPVRVLIDSALTASPDTKIFQAGEKNLKTIVFCHQDKDLYKNKSESYPANVEIVSLPSHGANSGSHLDLRAGLMELHKRGINNVLCEGGGVLAAALLESNLVDELYWFIAPKIMGDNKAKPSVESVKAVSIADIKNFRVLGHETYGSDFLIHALISEP